MWYQSFKAVFLLQLIEIVSGFRWYNWQNALTCKPKALFVPNDEEDLVGFIREQYPRKSMLKVVGKGHSFGNITTCVEQTTDNRNSYVISLDNLNTLEPLGDHKVKFGAGWSLEELVPALRDQGLSVVNLGSVRVQNYVGAFSTGTHGAGNQIGNIATQVVGFRVLDASGRTIVVNEISNAQLLPAFRINLGALGIITEVTIQAQPISYLKRTSQVVTTDEDWRKMYSGLYQLHQQHDRLQINGPRWIWNNSTQEFDLFPNMTVIWWDEIAGPAENLPLCRNDYCANGCGDCVRNYTCYDEVANALSAPPAGVCNRQFYAEFEHFTSSENYVDMAIDYTKHQFADPSVYKGIPNKEVSNGARFVRGDNAWMSPAHTDSSSTSNSSSHFAVFATDWFPEYNNFDALWHYQELIKTYTPIFGTKYKVRPHWGKMSYFDGSEAKQIYPALPIFLALQQRMDPYCQFVNSFLVGHLGIARCQHLFPNGTLDQSGPEAGNSSLLSLPVDNGQNQSLGTLPIAEPYNISAA